MIQISVGIIESISIFDNNVNNNKYCGAMFKYDNYFNFVEG